MWLVYGSEYCINFHYTRIVFYEKQIIFYGIGTNGADMSPNGKPLPPPKNTRSNRGVTWALPAFGSLGGGRVCPNPSWLG